MTLQKYILNEMKDMKRTLLFALDGLSREDLTSMEPVGHWPVAWIAMHLAAAMDTFVNFELTGQYTIEHDKRVSAWPFPGITPEDKWPQLDEIVSNWGKVMDKVSENIAALDDAGLQKVGGHLKFENWNYPISHVMNWMVMHHHQHMRMLWTILGERRVDDKWDEPDMGGE